MRTSAVTIVLFYLMSAVVAQSSPVRSYPVEGRGVIKLSVPEGWGEQVDAADDASLTIELSSPDKQTTLLITPLWSPKGDKTFNSTEEIAAAIGTAANSVQPTAVEKELVVRPIKTSAGEGRYFSATDRHPKAGEYKYMANGAVPAGELLLSFTVLSHVAPPEGFQTALQIVESAQHANE
jgi:hypothetical protein